MALSIMVGGPARQPRSRPTLTYSFTYLRICRGAWTGAMGRPSGPNSTRRRFFCHRLSILRGCGISALLLPPPPDPSAITTTRTPASRDGLAVEGKAGSRKPRVGMTNARSRRSGAASSSARGGLGRRIIWWGRVPVLCRVVVWCG